MFCVTTYNKYTDNHWKKILGDSSPYSLDGRSVFLSFWYSVEIRVSAFSTSIRSIARFIVYPLDGM